ncbi:MAG: response regulator [Myxococcota bacterium]
MQDDSKPIGLYVVDANMDDSIDFIAWAKKKEIPAFAFTANNAEGLEDRIMRAGAAFLLNKPVDIDALLTEAGFSG